MSFDPRLLRWLNYLGTVVVVGLVAFVGYISWRSNDSSQRANPVPSLDAYRSAVRRARSAASENRLPEAEQEYREALRLRPGSQAVILELAKFYEDHGKLTKAATHYASVFDGAVAHGAPVTRNTEAVVSYGDLCIRLGNTSRARQVFQILATNGNGYGGNSLRSLEELRAEGYSRVGRLDDAVKVNPKHWMAYSMGVLTKQGGEKARWLRLLAVAAKRFKGDPMGHIAYAETLQSLDRGKDAIAYLKRTAPTLDKAAGDLLLKRSADFERLKNGKATGAMPGKFDSPAAMGVPLTPAHGGPGIAPPKG